MLHTYFMHYFLLQIALAATNPIPIDRPQPINPGTLNTVVGETATLSRIDRVSVYITNWLWVITGAIAMLYILWAGIRYIRAQSDGSAAAAAKKSLLSTFVGLILFTMAIFLIQLAIGSGLLVNGLLSGGAAVF
jgi:hypothetical protein